MEAEVYVIVDGEGSYVVATDVDACHEEADNNSLTPVRRVICLTIKLPVPEPIAVEVDLPAEASQASVKVS